MKTIIAGSRNITDIGRLLEVIDLANWEISTVVSGTAKGVDKLGEEWAKMGNIPVERYPAEWDIYGKMAGMKRNGDMARIAEAAIILWDGKSKGTKYMIEMALKHGLKIIVNTI